MYAVIKTGGKQYRVQEGDVIDVERLPRADSEQVVIFDQVLMIGDLGGSDQTKIGSPVLEGATVRATSLGDIRGPKIEVFKMKRRKGYRRKNGHQQDLLRVRIEGIES